MQHARASNELFDAAAAREVALVLTWGVRMSRKLRHLIMDYSSAVLFLVTLAVQVFPRSVDAKPAGAAVGGQSIDTRTLDMRAAATVLAKASATSVDRKEQ